MNRITAANVVALAGPGLGLVLVSLARCFRVYLGLVWTPLIAWSGMASGRFYPTQLDT